MVSRSRRDFILDSGRALGSVAALGALPPGIRNALAMPANNRTGTIEDIEHIVVLMQENRSFDHYFGSLRGVRGYGDTRTITLPGGKPVWYQNAATDTGYLLPFHPDAENLGLQFIQDLPHDWASTHHAWNDGLYDQWPPAKGQATMAYLTRDDIPFHYQLADAFTICDAYHCSGMFPTDPNRYYMFTGWVGNDGNGGGPVIDNAEAGYSWLTYPEILEKAGVSWKLYQDRGNGLDAAGYWGYTSDAYIGNYGDNSLLYFDQYRNARPGDPLYEKARRGTHVAGGDAYLADLAADAKAGTLPQVSFIVAPEAFCEHPNWPTNYGAWYIDQVLQALTANPEVWSKTALLINYDENDGFFDHMSPAFASFDQTSGRSTVDTRNEYFGGDDNYAPGPYGLGPRVPMFVVSPWSRGGYVCSEVFDHTSVIRFIEKRFGHGHDLADSQITPWRRAVCGDLTSAFDFKTPNAGFPNLPSTAAYLPPDNKRHPDYKPQPPVEQSVPVQETGLRPARPLAYAFDVALDTSPAGNGLRLEFINSGRIGANFLVYRTASSTPPRSYTVEAGKVLIDALPADADGRYDLSIHGPNGFLRRFVGQASATGHGSGAWPQVAETALGAKAQLLVILENHGSAACEFTVKNAYEPMHSLQHRLRPGQALPLRFDLRRSHGWYDLSISCDDASGFRRRLAGHLENGRASMSDPALGGGETIAALDRGPGVAVAAEESKTTEKV